MVKFIISKLSIKLPVLSNKKHLYLPIRSSLIIYIQVLSNGDYKYSLSQLCLPSCSDLNVYCTIGTIADKIMLGPTIFISRYSYIGRCGRDFLPYCDKIS